jgi:hypothetical protein
VGSELSVEVPGGAGTSAASADAGASASAASAASAASSKEKKDKKGKDDKKKKKTAAPDRTGIAAYFENNPLDALSDLGLLAVANPLPLNRSLALTVRPPGLQRLSIL